METDTIRVCRSEDDPEFLGQAFFCSGHPCCHKIVNCVPGAGPIPPISCVGAAVSCLKLAVETFGLVKVCQLRLVLCYGTFLDSWNYVICFWNSTHSFWIPKSFKEFTLFWKVWECDLEFWALRHTQKHSNRSWQF